jgi:zinc/manganese transport system permease protein
MGANRDVAVLPVGSLCVARATGRSTDCDYLRRYRSLCYLTRHGICRTRDERVGVYGRFGGAIVVASTLGALAVKERERDTTIGVVLAFGLGIGVLLLSFYHGFATEATNILFGNIFGVSNGQLLILLGVGLSVLLVMAYIYRPLLFASIDPEVAEARGVSVKFLNIAFLYILALTVTAAAQVVGTLLVLSLAITPAAAAVRLTSKPRAVVTVSVLFALLASIGGLLTSLASSTLKPSVCITTISFGLYVFARLYGMNPPKRPVKTRETVA